MKKKNKLIGVLWKRKDKKEKDYMTGMIFDKKIIAFPVKKADGPTLAIYDNEDS